MLICIMLNTLILALSWYRQDERITYVFSIINDVFTYCFIAEAVIKIIGFGLRYFNNGWNNFDFIIAIICLVGLIVENYVQGLSSSAATAIRSFRLLKIL